MQQQIARPEWTSTLAGVVPALRLAISTGRLDARCQQLAMFLADEVEGAVARYQAVAGLSVSRPVDETGPSLRQVLLGAIEAAATRPITPEETLGELAADLRRVASAGSSPATDYVPLLRVLEVAAARLFGGARQHHLRSDEVEAFGTEPASLLDELHVQTCEECRERVEAYRSAAARAPFDQYPADE